VLAVWSVSSNAEVLVSGTVEAATAQTIVVPLMPTGRAQLAFHVNEGSQVGTGDVVLRFDTSEIDDRVRELEEAIATQQAELARQGVLADVELADAEISLQRALHARDVARAEASIPAQFIGDAESRNRRIALQVAEKTLEEASALVRHSEHRLAELRRVRVAKEAYYNALYEGLLRTQRSLTVVADVPGDFAVAYHPFQGTKFTVGETLRSGTVVGTISSSGASRIRAFLHEIDRDAVEVGQVVAVRVDAFPKLRLSARVAEIGDSLEPRPTWGRAAYYPVLLEWEGHSRDIAALVHGMSVVAIVEEVGK
jgi:HlyD family secretion protein